MGNESAPEDIFYVWHLPVRITHWVNVVAFFTLAITGFYIGAPSIALHGSPMLQVRIVHMLAGYVLTCSVAVRVVWAFIGDHGASWQSFFPYLKKGGWEKIRQELRFYLFLRPNPRRAARSSTCRTSSCARVLVRDNHRFCAALTQRESQRCWATLRMALSPRVATIRSARSRHRNVAFAGLHGRAHLRGGPTRHQRAERTVIEHRYGLHGTRAAFMRASCWELRGRSSGRWAKISLRTVRRPPG